MTTLLTNVSFVIMSRPEGKSLFLRNVPTALVREAKAAAAHRGETLTTIIAEALARSLGVAGDAGRSRRGLERAPASELDAADRASDLDHDIAWYRQERAKLLRRYRGEYVAIVDSAVVDHDRDFSALAPRVFTRFGNRSVYMPRVQSSEPVARIRSPRRSRP